MKKAVKALLIVLLINLLGSFVYAGPIDLPRPDSLETSTTIMEASIN